MIKNKFYFVIITFIIIITIFYLRNNYYYIDTDIKRKFDAINLFDRTRINNIIQNLQKDNDEEIKIEIKIFENFDCFLLNKVPEKVDKDCIIYFPEIWKQNFPMYFEDKHKVKYFYPTKNSLIITEEELYWVGNNNNFIIIGERKK